PFSLRQYREDDQSQDRSGKQADPRSQRRRFDPLRLLIGIAHGSGIQSRRSKVQSLIATTLTFDIRSCVSYARFFFRTIPITSSRSFRRTVVSYFSCTRTRNSGTPAAARAVLTKRSRWPRSVGPDASSNSIASFTSSVSKSQSTKSRCFP